MESFVNNPFEWSVEGNLIGVLLGNLSDLTGFTGSHSTVTEGTAREINGLNIEFICVDYQA